MNTESLLRKLQPYIEDLQKENIHDPSVGIRYDHDLEEITSAIREALTSPAPEVAATSDNELIAKFMGLKKHPEKDWWMVSDELAPGLTHNWSELKFDSDWRWLMPVVEKIPTLNKWENKRWFEYELVRCHCHIYSNDELSIEFRNNGGTLLDATYRTVVNFIKWFNTQTPKS